MFALCPTHIAIKVSVVRYSLENFSITCLTIEESSKFSRGGKNE